MSHSSLDHSATAPHHLLIEFARAGINNSTGSPGLGVGGSSAEGKGKKRAREQHDDGDHIHFDGDGGGRKAGSAAGSTPARDGTGGVAQRSCDECKRRKVKCDRKIPCANCVRRGNGNMCAAESTKPRPPRRTNYALASDVEQLTKRLAEVEKALNIRPPPPKAERATYSNHSTPSFAGHLHHSPDDFDETESIGSGDDAGQLERAATTLEIAAYDPKPTDTSGHRAVDSLVFFDNTNPKYHLGRALGRTGEDLELTSVGTSILAPRRESWWSCAAEMGLDFTLDPSELPAARANAVVQLVTKLLPTQPASNALIDAYYGGVNWYLEGGHRDIFKVEHERFWQMIGQGRLAEVDPLWLAVYFIMLALATSGVGIIGNHAAQLPPNPPVSDHCYSAARRLMHLGDWSGTPRVRTIQVVLMMVNYVQLSPAGEAGRLMTWIAGAVRVAQALGLHALGDDDDIMPPDDSAWPSGKNARKRQVALRLFTALRLVDWSSSIRYCAYLLHDDQVTTGEVANIDLMSAASVTDCHYTSQPPDQITDATFLRFSSAVIHQSRRIFQMVTLRRHGHVQYETVLDIDNGFQEILRGLPVPWQRRTPPSQDHITRWRRHACSVSIHNRLVKLHRPFMLRGYHDGSPHRYSTQQCIESAHVVIESHYEIMDVTRSLWFSYSHVLTASLALFADLFHSIDSGAPTSELDKKSEFLVRAAAIFADDDKLSNVVMRGIAQQGAKVISGLFMAERKRRRMREDGTSGTSPPETFTQILQQITRDLDPKTPGAPMPLPLHSDVHSRSAALGQPAASGLPPPTQQFQQPMPAFMPYPDGSDAFHGANASLDAVLGMNGAAPPMVLEEATLNGNGYLDVNAFDWSWLQPANGAEGSGSFGVLPGW